MTAHSPERLAQSPAHAEPVLDELALRIERELHRDGDRVSEDDGLWVGRLRRIGAAMVARWGYPGLVESAELLISELVTNALRYGADDAIAFRLARAADAFVIEVDDGSPGRPQVRAAGPDEESGRGMLLVSVVADEWGVSPDGTCTWCLVKIPQAGQAS
ncbi:ATP-binding protein [Streptomyces polygonati]|uniref:ATP-binding protein n=1 Tax=Streptomyces polygonati TaxID=1617087 RepID=A0ABV8HIV1_9ACTN